MANLQTSSRVFVKGIPPSLSEDDFQRHFSKIHPITDARLLRQRRIGYVGYRSPEAAESAVKYFNKTFIKMSKIGVELARSVSRNIGIAELSQLLKEASIGLSKFTKRRQLISYKHS
jgi:multiple RNA-binding domain-containing protein 1